MPKLPSAQDFGERPTPRPQASTRGYQPVAAPDVGTSIGQIGTTLADARSRIEARRDAVNRVRESGRFAEEVEQDLRAFESETDISDPDAVRKFGETVRAKIGQYVDSHQGSRESRARFAERLEGIKNVYGERVATLAFNAQRGLMSRTIGQSVSSLSAEAVKNPGAVEDYFARLDSVLGDLEPALSTPEAETARAGGRAEILKSAVSGLIERGGYLEARDLLAKTPNAAAYLSPEDQRTINSQIIRAEMVATKAEAAAKQKLAELRVVLGRDPTPQERARAAGVAPPQGPQTLSDKIREYESVVRRPASQDEIAKLSGTYVAPRERNTLLGKVADFEEVMGREATEEEKRKLAGLSSDASGKQTLKDKIAEFAAAAGREPTKDEFAKLAGTYVAETSQKPTLKERVAELEDALGRKATDEERAKLAGAYVVTNGQKPTLAGRIAELESALGRPATEQERAKLAGALVENKGDEGDFGNSLTGRALDIITRDAPAYRAGLLSEAEERRFMSAVAQYTQPSMMPNPATGLMESRAPQLPPFVVDALRARGQAVPTPMQPGQPAAPQAATPGAPAVAPIAPVGQPPVMQPPGQTRPEQPRTSPEAAMGGRTIFEMAGDIAGPIPAVGEALSRTPGVGVFVQAPQFTQARNSVDILKRDLTRTLANNPRYAEGERQAIEKDIAIDASVWDTPGAFRQRMIAIDDALALRADSAYKTANSPAVSLPERQQAMNVLNAITHFRQTMGVPPRVKTPEEAKKLGSGALFVDPSGNLRRVP